MRVHAIIVRRICNVCRQRIMYIHKYSQAKYNKKCVNDLPTNFTTASHKLNAHCVVKTHAPNVVALTIFGKTIGIKNGKNKAAIFVAYARIGHSLHLNITVLALKHFVKDQNTAHN